mmetsp:Transcript_6392/g.23410  ORF Transcript_6392/g.23410 Transcript_6392/m.23410 type:complete len:311 (-) Transcript_6392:798-1730(-)
MTSATRSPLGPFLARIPGRSRDRRSSPHALSLSHSGAGFVIAFSPVEIPPVRKNRSSPPSIFIASLFAWSSSATATRRRIASTSSSTAATTSLCAFLSSSSSSSSSLRRSPSSSDPPSGFARSAAMASRSLSSASSPRRIFSRAAASSSATFARTFSTSSAPAPPSSASKIFVAIKKAYRSLSFSNSDRHTLTYRKNVKCDVMFFSLVGTSTESSASSMPRMNKSVNHWSEYWYMSPMFARSTTQKNMMLLCFASGRYPARVSSIAASVSSATFCFSEISSDKTFDALRIFTAPSSSKMFPSDDDSTFKI